MRHGLGGVCTHGKKAHHGEKKPEAEGLTVFANQSGSLPFRDGVSHARPSLRGCSLRLLRLADRVHFVGIFEEGEALLFVAVLSNEAFPVVAILKFGDVARR
jgi:hypothetical protein